MNQFYILLIVFTIGFSSYAQIVNIPDTILKNRLVGINSNCVDTDGDGDGDTNADFNGDGEIQVSEAEAVTSLYLTTYNSNTFSSTVGLEAFVNLEILEFNGNSISTFDASVYPNLIGLNCSNNNLTTLNLTGLSNLEELRCVNNELSAINVIDLTTMNYFNCSQNQLNQLNLSGLVNLVDLLCSENQLAALNLSDLQNLQRLNCQENQLTTLDFNGLMNLEQVWCYDNFITSITSGNLPNLFELNCSGNQITSYDFSGLTSLTHFNSNDNQLTSIDLSSLVNLEELRCDNNQFTTLDVSALSNLDDLYCSYNELTTLDLSNQTGLRTLSCRNNNLTEIDLSNHSQLRTIQVSNNLLTSLDLSNTSGQNINCSNNLLEYINVKNGRLTTSFSEFGTTYEFSFNNNPSLTYICADAEVFEAVGFELDEIDRIQTYIDIYGLTNCFVNSYCSFIPGGNYNIIEGSTSIDLNSDGCDNDSLIYPNLKFTISNESETGTLISNSSGDYSISVQNGSHTISPILENMPYYGINPSNLTVDFPTEDSPFLQDFCITPNGTFNDLEVTIIPLDGARPGFDANYKLVYKNKGTTILSGSVDLSFQDDFIDLVSSSPTEDSQTTNILSWNFTDLDPFESREILFTMNINTPSETPPVNGDDVLVFDASVNMSETDETPEDNSFTLNQTVVNSFDPNDKTCLQGAIISPNMVGDYVHYRIRFENTGTANAINVVVKDHIDRTKFDLSTLVPIDASHDYVARIQDNADDYYVEFIFENINLPFDDANNDGYIVFKIKTLDTLVLNDTFENEAEIYFDFNHPIYTNIAITTVATLSTADIELADNSIVLYPNPTQNTLNIKSEQTIDQLIIYDIAGRRIQEISNVGTESTMKIDTKALQAGTYFIEIRNETSEIVKAFIKQ